MVSGSVVTAGRRFGGWRVVVSACAGILAGALGVAACSGPSSAPVASSPSPFATPVPPVAFDGQRVLADVKVLASDEFEGRAPGTAGEQKTVDYLVAKFKEIGLQPGNPDGTFIQNVPLVGITGHPAPLTFTKGGASTVLRYRDDFIAWTKRVTDEVALRNSELVFVGYGIQAPEFDWDDYKGVDVRGKTLVMLINDPPVPDPANPSALDPKLFGGPAMTYYGRWTYKFEIGAEKGAAGVLIVHETEPAGYPFAVVQGNAGERFDLVTPDKNMGRAAIEGWLHLDQAKKLFATAGQDFDALKRQALGRDFKPVSLGVTASMTLRNTLRTIDSRNVVARLDGGDPAHRQEFVVYSAHWDHFGVGEPVGGDAIYNGAHDNATGTAALLELARAYKALPAPPKRSVLFLSVTAEEQGLLGSEYYATQPLYPLAKTLANINIDGLNVHGATKDIVLIGLGSSELDDYARQAAADEQRVVKPDPEPEKGFYYRSDHFNFAKQGVPALDPDSGIDYVGRPPEYGVQMRERYTAEDYHKPSDEVKPDWDMAGVVQDLQLFFSVGYRIGQADAYPSWRPGTEFRARREAQLKAASSR